MKVAVRSMIAESAGAAGPLLALTDAMQLRDPVWQDLALCAEMDPEIFFPEETVNPYAAKKACGVCEVRDECLEYTLSLDEDPEGIWAGLNQRSRRAIRRQREAQMAPAVTVPEKHCTACDTTKSADEFWKNRTKHDGLHLYCISCSEAGRGRRSAA